MPPARRATSPRRAVGQSVAVVLPDDLPQGTQIVSYRVVSQDGHPVAGSMVFSIGAVTGAAPPAKARSAGGADLAGADRRLSRAVRRRRRRVLRGLDRAGRGPDRRSAAARSLIGLVSAVASLGLQGLDLLDLPLGGIVTSAPWTSALATSPRAVAADRDRRRWPSPSLRWRSPGSLIARMLTALAHGGRRPVAGGERARRDRLAAMADRPSLFLHGVARGLLGRRAGAAGGDGVSARRRPAARASGFRALAVPLVGLLVLTGLALAIVQLGSFGALIETRYGIILSIKLALVDPAARPRGAEPVSSDAGASSPIHENTRPLLRSILTGMRSRRLHPGRRRRLALHAAAARARLLPPSRRCRSISTPIPRCSRCWSRRARSAPTISCCS